MYRHLLVPVDQTDLSIEVVGNAVGLAHAVGARVTFFHAEGSQAGNLRDDAADAQSTAEAEAADVFASRAEELLAKAEAAARAFGVPCGSKRVVSDRVDAAAIEAARDGGCDLIIMGAHALRSEADTTRAAEKLRLAMNAGVSMLISSVRDPGPSARAIGMIRDEHRSLAAALRAWMHVLEMSRKAARAADAPLMREALRYTEAFLLAAHDRQEEHLFRRLRERTHSVDAELDELGRQHARQRERMAELAARVATLAAARGQAAISATRDLDDAVRGYASLVWDHLGREEGVILPAAQRHFSDVDWSQIEAAFVIGREPDADGDSDAEVRRLFLRILDAARNAA